MLLAPIPTSTVFFFLISRIPFCSGQLYVNEVLAFLPLLKPEGAMCHGLLDCVHFVGLP